MAEFDSTITVPMRGLKDLKDYQEQASTVKHLHKIHTPLFCLQSEDDFVIDAKVLPRSLEAQNVVVAIAKCGSHCCFFSGDVKPDLFVGNVFFRFFNYYQKK